MSEQYTPSKVSADAMTINPLLRDMNLPVNRRDVDKPETLKWLVHNLGMRNSTHRNYQKVRQLLVSLSRKRRLFKESELRDLENSMKEIA